MPPLNGLEAWRGGEERAAAVPAAVQSIPANVTKRIKALFVAMQARLGRVERVVDGCLVPDGRLQRGQP